ncbi:DUF3297 family protein [Novosphingobium mangrovi (ex Huang et al. 2023)]|uniref:DUF3297 family protein n=1 Tax=Novosphingobium mangrovi (ex Huang et al. 2023) TaxID=2976432 RepID=A0ABT2I129_9SPHN|nr:DUF3297 family protein [Novosphingobium mangrovi (ex Huang et al. 2023)]MCT2398510.1 DUF3297 family protein [Novosphingobium mangrovi (ex Huang et al. 2023)]
MGYPETPPERLSNDPTHPDYHPCLVRVGIRFDGSVRSDVCRYDIKRGLIVIRSGKMHFGEVEPFWRWDESRQERRARERFDQTRGARA